MYTQRADEIDSHLPWMSGLRAHPSRRGAALGPSVREEPQCGVWCDYGHIGVSPGASRLPARLFAGAGRGHPAQRVSSAAARNAPAIPPAASRAGCEEGAAILDRAADLRDRRRLPQFRRGPSWIIKPRAGLLAGRGTPAPDLLPPFKLNRAPLTFPALDSDSISAIYEQLWRHNAYKTHQLRSTSTQYHYSVTWWIFSRLHTKWNRCLSKYLRNEHFFRYVYKKL